MDHFRTITEHYWCLITIFALSGITLLSCGGAQAITENAPSRDISLMIEEVEVDAFHNIYILDKKNKIRKFNKSLQETYFYADNTLGKIQNIDISDPLKILAYKKDYGTIIQLDNTLNEINRIELPALGFNQVPAVGGSADDQFWIYDAQDYKLKKMDFSGRVVAESINMAEYNLLNLEPSMIFEKKGKLIIQDEEMGVLLFDNLAEYIQTFPIFSDSEVQFDGDKILYYADSNLKYYDTALYADGEIDISSETNNNPISVKADKLYTYYIYRNGLNRSDRPSER